MSFEVKAEGVDVERLLADVHNRIEERRKAGLYTDEELRFIAERALDGVLAGRDLRADLARRVPRARRPVELLLRRGDRLYRSSRGVVGRALEAPAPPAPVQKLFWNPNPMISALSRQSDLNRFYVHLLHNLVLELSRLSLEVQELRSRNLQTAGRLEALARREKTLEDMVAYRDEGGTKDGGA
jgi:hypothetical protein